MAKNEIAVNQAPMTGNETVEPEEQDLAYRDVGRRE